MLQWTVNWQNQNWMRSYYIMFLSNESSSVRILRRSVSGCDSAINDFRRWAVDSPYQHLLSLHRLSKIMFSLFFFETLQECLSEFKFYQRLINHLQCPPIGIQMMLWNADAINIVISCGLGIAATLVNHPTEKFCNDLRLYMEACFKCGYTLSWLMSSSDEIGCGSFESS